MSSSSRARHVDHAVTISTRSGGGHRHVPCISSTLSTHDGRTGSRHNLRLRDRPFDWFFIVVFSLFAVTSMISDMLPTLGVEFFGEPEWVTPNPVKFLAFNLPYVLIPILLLIRMRRPLPFARRF